MNKMKYIAAALVAVAALGFQQAKADTFSFDLNVGNTAISGFPGPYANVSITLTSNNTANFTVTAYAGFLFGGAQAFDFNANASSSTVTNIVFNGTSISDSGPGNADGFGNFNHTMDGFDGFTNAGTLLTFTLTGGAGTNWLSAAQVLIANAGGWLAAAHIFAILNSSVSTGFAGGQGLPGTPDGGATVMLLGMGLGALGMVRRYLKH